MSRAALSIALLTGVYALMLASVHPLDLVLGAALATALVLGLRGFLFPGGFAPLAGGPAAVTGLAGLVAWILREIVVGTWDVARAVLGIRPPRSPGVVELPMDDRTDGGVVFAAFLATLSPGEFVVDFDWERRVVLMHLLDASDPEAARARWRSAYERHQRAVWP